MAVARRPNTPEDPQVAAAALDAAAARLDALRTLGVAVPTLTAKLAAGQRALDAGDAGAAQAAADEILIPIKLAAGEIARILSHEPQAFAGGPRAAAPSPPTPQVPSAPPLNPQPSTLNAAPVRDVAPDADVPEAVAAVVADAFQKALYSRALRQMVETIAAERVAALLESEGLVGDAFAARVKREAARP